MLEVAIQKYDHCRENLLLCREFIHDNVEGGHSDKDRANYLSDLRDFLKRHDPDIELPEIYVCDTDEVQKTKDFAYELALRNCQVRLLGEYNRQIAVFSQIYYANKTLELPECLQGAYPVYKKINDELEKYNTALITDIMAPYKGFFAETLKFFVPLPWTITKALQPWKMWRELEQIHVCQCGSGVVSLTRNKWYCCWRGYFHLLNHKKIPGIEWGSRPPTTVPGSLSRTS